MGKREEQSEARKKRIVEAASKLFSEQGYKQTSIAAIAKEAGVSKGLVYFFFETKKELFDSIMRDQLFIWMEETKRLAELPVSPLEKIRLAFTTPFDVFRENPMLGQILSDPEADIQDFTPIIYRIHSLWQKHLQSLLESGRAIGQLRRDIDLVYTADFIHTTQQVYLARAMGIVPGGSPDKKKVNALSYFIVNSITRPEYQLKNSR